MERNDIEEHEYQELFSISRSPPSQQIINDGSWNHGQQQHQAADNTVTIIQRKEATRALYITLIVAVIIIISLVVLICVIVVVFISPKAPAGATTTAPAGATTAGNGKVTVSTTTQAGATTTGDGKVTVSTTAPAGATTAGNGKVTVSTTTPAGATTAGNGKVTVSTTAQAGATTAGNGKVTVSTTAPAGATTAGNGKVTVSTTAGSTTTGNGKVTVSTTDPFSCTSRTTGDNIPREYTHPSHCKEYYWCVNGAVVNRTCPESSFYIAYATPVLACTSDYTLSFCALKSSSSPPPSKCDCSTYAYIAGANTYPGNCSQYYWCVNGVEVPRECGPGQQVYFNISEDNIPCTNIPSDYYCKHVEDGNLQPCA